MKKHKKRKDDLDDLDKFAIKMLLFLCSIILMAVLGLGVIGYFMYKFIGLWAVVISVIVIVSLLGLKKIIDK